MKVRPTKKRTGSRRASESAGEVVMELSQRDETLLDAANDPATLSGFRIRRILVPMDFSACAKKALSYAVPLAREHNAVITLLYVAPPNYSVSESLEKQMRKVGEQNLAQLADQAAGTKVTTTSLVRVGSPTREILDVARSQPADIIVMSTHGHSALQQVLLGSVTEHVVRHAPCPVLVVREQEHEFIAV